tara:strand:+ start:2104 stop:2304 length:201 start_codon:yes stop_codon:yes gene_type:complete
MNDEYETILVITYDSGMMTYIPKNKDALDFILSNFDWIAEVVEVEREAMMFSDNVVTINPKTGEAK